jgi:hypothetical protein
VTSNPDSNEETSAMPTNHTIELANLPGWATSSFIEDGYVYSKRESELTPDVEMVQASELVLDLEAKTISFRAAEEPTIWMPGTTEGMPLAQARDVLTGLQELLGILDEAPSDGSEVR